MISAGFVAMPREIKHKVHLTQRAQVEPELKTIS